MAIHEVARLDRQPGDLASLRRIDPENPDSPIFWKLAVRNFAQGEHTPWMDEALPGWAAFLKALAQLSGLVLTEQFTRPSFGAALALAQLSEVRLLRLFRAGETLPKEIQLAVHQVAQRGIKCNPFDLGLLLLETRPEDADKVRRRIAHDYYRQQHSSHSESTTPTSASKET